MIVPQHDEIDGFVGDLFMDGLTWQEIADRLQLTFDQVNGRIRKMQEAGELPPPHRRWSHDEEDALRHMVDNGVSDEEIAMVLSRTVIAIFRKRYKLGVLRVRRNV